MRKDTISVRLLQEALLGFTRSGQSAETLLAELGFAQLPLHQPDERISVDHYSAVWLRLAAVRGTSGAHCWRGRTPASHRCWSWKKPDCIPTWHHGEPTSRSMVSCTVHLLHAFRALRQEYAPAFSSIRTLISGVSPELSDSERPEYRDEDHSQYPEDQVQRQAHLDEVHEAVAAGAVDHGIGLVAHRCGKTGGGGEGDGDEEGGRIHPHQLGCGHADRRQDDRRGSIAQIG